MLAGLRLDSSDPMGWSRVNQIILASIFMYAMGVAVTWLGAKWILPLGMYLASGVTLAAASTVAYLKLHPSVQIGYHERIKDMVFGAAVVCGAGGVALAALLAGIPLVGLVLAGLLLVVTAPMIVRSTRIVVAAHREAEEEWEDEEEDEEEEDEEDEARETASITEHLAGRREAWQLAPPPSVVAADEAPDIVVPDSLDTATLPPRRPASGEREPR